MTRQSSGALDLALAGVAMLLPSSRSDWGVAMRAELVGLRDRDPATRRRFALGCARAVLTMPGVITEMAVRVLALGLAIAAVRRFTAASAGVFAEAIAVLVVISGLAWWGARQWPLGPVAPGWSARVARAAGALLLLSILAWFLSGPAGGAPRDPSGWWIAGAAVAVCWTAWLALTSVGLQGRTLAVVLGLAFSAGAVWWLTSVATTVFAAAPIWPVLLVVSTALVACLLGRSGTDPGQIVRAACGTALATALLIFAAAAAASAAHPDPNHEAMDPMVGVLMIAGLAGGLMLLVLRRGACRLSGTETGPDTSPQAVRSPQI